MTLDNLMQSIVTAQEEMLKHSIEANSVTLNGRKYGKLIENLPPNIKPTICGMAVKSDYALPDDYDFLVQYEPPQPKTNADRIRSMTDEELAEWLWFKVGKCPPFDVCPSKCIPCEAKYCWLDWLRKEVD